MESEYISIGLYAPDASFVDFQSSMNGWSTTIPADYLGDGFWNVSFRPPTYLTYNWFADGILETFDYIE